MSTTAAPRAGRRANGRERLPTPTRILAMTAAITILAVVLAVVIASAADGTRGGLRRIGHSTGPEVMATSDLNFALNDMDAQVSNALLLSTDPGTDQDRAVAIAGYETRREQADRDLQQAAAVGADDPQARQQLPVVLDALGRYETIVGQTLMLDGSTRHGTAKPSPQVLALYKSATWTLEKQLRPAATRLTLANERALQRTYQSSHTAALTAALATALAGLILVGVLGWLQLWLSRRFRRRFNPALLTATAAALTLTFGGTGLFAAEAGDLRGAKKDAFDSIFALSQARAVGDDANADDSRFLVSPSFPLEYGDAFLDKTRQILTPATVTWTHRDYYDTVVQEQREYEHDHSAIAFGGFFGTEFRNLTFDGERAAAELVLRRYLRYLADDLKLHELVTTGKGQEAISFKTTSSPNGLSDHFAQYDTALSDLITINKRAFTRSIGTGEDDLREWSLLPWLGMVLVIGLTVTGVWPRLAEYR